MSNVLIMDCTTTGGSSVTTKSTQMDKIQICSVIVSYNSPYKLVKCIDSLLNQVSKIVVIDNSTERNSKDIITGLNYGEKVLFIFNEDNKGLGFALNQGLQYSLVNNYAWTLLLDQDSELAQNMISEMFLSYQKLNNCEKEKTASIVPVVYEINSQREIPSLITTNLLNKRVKRPQDDTFIHFHITSGSLIKNRIIERIGLMNENFFIDYIDYDFCFRILDNNCKILLSKNALLYHSLAKTIYNSYFHFKEHDPLRVYYQTRNRLFTLFKYGKKYKSFLYEDSFRFIGKFLKIVFLESNKVEKIKLMFRGISEFYKTHNTIFTNTSI